MGTAFERRLTVLTLPTVYLLSIAEVLPSALVTVGAAREAVIFDAVMLACCESRFLLN